MTASWPSLGNKLRGTCRNQEKIALCGKYGQIGMCEIKTWEGVGVMGKRFGQCCEKELLSGGDLSFRILRHTKRRCYAGED
jgi:hypothetical protein